MFTDRLNLHLCAGKGGDGVINWRREKYIPKGGPAGGDGGRGGSVFIQAETSLFSLEHLCNKSIIRAQDGAPGEGKNCTGANGDDITIKVPLGTLIKNAKTGELLYDLTTAGERWEACRGGEGGKGNTRFKTATHQTPYVRTLGTEGETKEIELELKLIADVGLVGMPNAGKSTLISRLANVSCKAAPYPFTTLRPNLAVLEFEDFSRLFLADIPGIIEGASQDRGLGFTFLRHVERTKVLVFLLELAPWDETRDPFQEFELLRAELSAYNPELLNKPCLIVLNKLDLEGAGALIDAFREKVSEKISGPVYTISAQEGTGCPELSHAIREIAQRDGKRF